MLDSIDRKLLTLLQNKSDIPISSIAQKVHLSKTACWNRIQKLQKNKVIVNKNIEIDYKKIGYGIKAILLIKTNSHHKEWLNKFAEHVKTIPQVIAFYRLTGEIDYILKILSKNMDEYNEVYKKLISVCSIYSISTAIVMEEQHKPICIPKSDS